MRCQIVLSLALFSLIALVTRASGANDRKAVNDGPRGPDLPSPDAMAPHDASKPELTDPRLQDSNEPLPPGPLKQLASIDGTQNDDRDESKAEPTNPRLQDSNEPLPPGPLKLLANIDEPQNAQ